MKGNESKIIKFLEGSGKRFVIPVYQRKYDWKPDNCKQLFDDLVKIVKNNRKSHFFGSLVSAYNPDGYSEEFLIIDGQQRLTTVTLLLLAAYNLMKAGIIIPEREKLPEQILESYLIDKFASKDKRIKLRLVKEDQDAFVRLFDESNELLRDKKPTVNYDYFYERIQKQEITVDQLFDAISRLEIIDIQLNPDDNPQLIFESLNSTGLDLNEGDKIRNYILMGLPTDRQEAFYEKYWQKIEKYTDDDVSAFVRDYLSVKLQTTPAQSKVYVAFKDFAEPKKNDIEPLLQEMLDYAKRYALLIGETAFGVKELDAGIVRLNRLETTVTRPFFLEVLRLRDEKKLTPNEVTEIFLLTESYLFRRAICDVPTNSLNKIFLLLHREIERYDGSTENYVEKFKYAIASKRERGRRPDDEEFARAFSEKPVYLMQNKNKIYLLERLENFNTKEVTDVYSLCDEGTLSIEHVMPQHLTPAWQSELGEDYARIHEEWLHRIANLTLTAYNSKYSNNSFTEKKTMEHGFESSGVHMNIGWIAKKDKWTLAELEERSEHLVGLALKIWPAPVSEYQSPEKQLEFCTLADDEELTGRLIAKFSFKNAEQPVENWSEMFQKVVKILYEQDKSIITKLVYDEYKELGQFFSNDPLYFAQRPTVEVDAGIYVTTNTSTQSKLSILIRLFERYGENPSDLVFYLRDENDSKTEEEAARFDLRRRYWDVALPIIQKAHGDNGPYSNRKATKSDWIGGNVGLGENRLSCVALYNSARTEFMFDSSDKETNKAAFDRLYAHKEEIESKLGTPLQWVRNDDCKSSKVFVELTNAGLQNETDWIQTANFHAKWVCKFLETIVPLVKAELPQ